MKKLWISTFAVIFATALTACSKEDPAERYVSMCTDGKDICECSAAAMSEKLSDDDFHALIDELEKYDVNDEQQAQELAMKMLSGTLVNEDVSMTFMESSKNCAMEDMEMQEGGDMGGMEQMPSQ